MPEVTDQDAERRTSEEPDPLASLHRMSTTAGLQTREYVAINPWAVGSFLLGVASFLAVLTPYFLALPAVAVVVGVVALVQIRNSNGTQSGRVWALLGLLLALGVGVLEAGRVIAHALESRSDRREIRARLAELGQRINAQQYD